MYDTGAFVAFTVKLRLITSIGIMNFGGNSGTGGARGTGVTLISLMVNANSV